MRRCPDDTFLEILASRWNEASGVLDARAIIADLGSEDDAGDFFAQVLASDLRGWHAPVARELRQVVSRHLSPPPAWLANLWSFAQASITTDPDEMGRLFTLMRTAKADSVRKWLADPLVGLAERNAPSHKLLGFEGLECLVKAGGAIHLATSILRLKAIASSTDDPWSRECAGRIIGMLHGSPAEATLRGWLRPQKPGNWFEFPKWRKPVLHNVIKSIEYLVPINRVYSSYAK